MIKPLDEMHRQWATEAKWTITTNDNLEALLRDEIELELRL